jgi:hypothetical protein
MAASKESTAKAEAEKPIKYGRSSFLACSNFIAKSVAIRMPNPE